MTAAARSQGEEKVRTTVDLPREVNRALRVLAVERDTTLQGMLAALAAALADHDRRMIAVLDEATGKRKRR